MGGHNAGEIASGIVVDTVVNALSQMEPKYVTKEKVVDILSAANRNVLKNAAGNINRRGMGSTATMAVFNGNDAIIGQIGDSRAYLFSHGVLTQITKDHSYVQMLVDSGSISPEEAKNHPHKNIVTRAIGIDDEVDVDVFYITMEKDDVLMLCSDGLNTLVTDDEITQVLNADIVSATDKLIDLALKRGGTDNISVVIAQVGE